MVLSVQAEAPPLSIDGGGAVRVSGTRVTFDALVYAHNAGHTPEQIAADYPSVPLADVYAVIGFYLRHQDQVDAYLRRREEEAEQLRRDLEARFPNKGPTKAELLARWEKKFGAPFPHRASSGASVPDAGTPHR